MHFNYLQYTAKRERGNSQSSTHNICRLWGFPMSFKLNDQKFGENQQSEKQNPYCKTMIVKLNESGHSKTNGPKECQNRYVIDDAQKTCVGNYFWIVFAASGIGFCLGAMVWSLLLSIR